jgi:hypothetical protein
MIKKGFGGLIKKMMNDPKFQNIFKKLGTSNAGNEFNNLSGLSRRATYDKGDMGGFQKTTGQNTIKAKKGMLIQGKPKLTKKGWK